MECDTQSERSQDTERDLQVVGEAADGAEALALCRMEHPDVVLMEVRMPRMDGLEATRAIKQEMPRTAVLVVTMQENPDYLYEALKAGASGYLLNDASRTELVRAVRSVLSGEPLLTPLELEVLRVVARGLTNREIASELGLSPATVKVHVEHIITKLGVSDRTQAAVRAVELGVLGSQ